MATKTGYSAGRVFLQVVPSYKNFMTALRRDARGPLGKAIADTFEKELEKSGAKSGEAYGKKMSEGIRKSVRTDALTADLKKKLGKALDDVGDDTSRLGRKLVALQNDIEKTGKVTDDHVKRQRALATELLATAEATDSLAKKQRLMNAAGSLDPSVPRDYAAAQRDMARETRNTARAEAEAERATRRRGAVTRDTDRDTNVAARSLSRLSGVLSGVRGDSQDGANAFRFFNFAVLATAALGAGLIPVLAGVAGGLALLAPVLGGIGAGLGVAALGFSGISDAVKALSEQEDAASTSSTGYARSMRNAARAVADARRSLKDAYRSNAEGIERALESQADAERSLAKAQIDARDAQRQLTEARKEAKQEQEDLSNKIAQNQLDERQGVIDLFNAYNTYGAVMADGGSTNLEREQADIALKQAQLNLKMIREEEKRLAEQKKESDKQGIKGSDAVKSATERLTDALERQRDAQRRLERATRDVSRARADGARGIEDAQRSLTRAQEDYNDALQGGATAIDKVDQAMSKLSPAQQRFARYLFSLKGDLADLREIAAAGLLPGVEDLFRRVIGTYGPGMRDFVRGMSSDLGDLAVDAGKTFTNPVWRDFFRDMSEASRQFNRDAIEGTLGFMTGFVAIMDESLPYARKLSNYVKEIGERFGLWAASDAGREQVRGFFAYIDSIGPKVRDFFVALGDAVARVAEAFAPIGESVLVALTGLLDRISRMDDKKIRQVGVAVAIMVIALQSAAGIMAVISLAAAIATAPLLILVGAVAGLAGAFLLLGNSSEENKKFFTDLLDTLEPLISAVKDLYKIFKDQLIKTWNEALLPALREITKALQKDLLPAFKRFWPVVRPLVKFIANLFGVVLRGAIEGAKNVILGLIKVLTGVLDFITGVFTGDWQLAWDGIKNIFSGVVQAIWGLVNLWLFGKVLGGIKQLFTKDILKVLNGARKFIVFAAKQPFRLISAYFTAWKSLVLKTMRGVVTSIGAILGGLNEARRKVVGWFGNIKEKALEAMEGLRDDIGGIMKSIADKLKKPIVAFLDIVLNDGLIDGVRTLQGWVGVKDKNKLKHIGGFGGKYKDGGVLPGFTPGRDPHKFYSPTGGKLELSGGEAIMRPEWTRAVGGKGAVARMNAMARRGQAFAKGGIFWPTVVKTLSGNYPGHTGVDISGAGINGKPVFAAHSGKVTATPRWNYSYGNHVRIKGTDGIETIYGHLSKILARVGQKLSGGTQIGNVGSTGNSTGPHLHFEVRPGGTRAAALAYLNNGKIPKGGTSSSGSDKVDNLSSTALKALKNPLSWLNKRVVKGMGSIGGGSGMRSLLGGIPSKLLSGVAKQVKEFAMKALDVGSDFFAKNSRVPIKRWGSGGAGPRLYDNGGYLPPGLSMVMNKTSKPEPVLTSEQWDRIRAAATGGGPTYNLKAEGADPRKVIDEFVGRMRFEQRRVVRSGTLSSSVAS